MVDLLLSFSAFGVEPDSLAGPSFLSACLAFVCVAVQQQHALADLGGQGIVAAWGVFDNALESSLMAQGKRGGLITHRSLDRNQIKLHLPFFFFSTHLSFNTSLHLHGWGQWEAALSLGKTLTSPCGQHCQLWSLAKPAPVLSLTVRMDAIMLQSPQIMPVLFCISRSKWLP
jgi:hypothetical protein